MITPMQLKAAFPACRNPGIWCRAIGAVVDEFDLSTPARLSMFVTQCGYESASFNVTRELMAYQTVEKLRAVFPREFTDDDTARKYVMNPQGLANFIYAGKLGNGDVASGDGFKYRGGGLIQLTGRANYKAAGQALGLDLELRPLQITSEPVAARTAGYFWKLKDLNAAADAGDFDHTTRAINGTAMAGAEQRCKFWTALTTAMELPANWQVAQAARLAVTAPRDGVMTPGFRLSKGQTPPGNYDPDPVEATTT